MPKIYLTAFILSLNAYLVLSQFLCNNASLNDLDEAMARALNIGKYFRSFPETMDEVEKFCDEEYNYVKQIENYKTRCLKNLPKQLTSIIVYTTKSMINTLCRSKNYQKNKRLRRLLSGAPCANQAHREYDKCQRRYIDKLQGIVRAEDNQKIPHTCCQYYKIFPCMRTLAKKHEICTEDKIEANIEYASDIFTNTFNTLCGDWTEESDKCSKLPNPPRKSRSVVRAESFLIPFIKVLDSFPEV